MSTAGKTLTLIQIGDIHGHLLPRANLRSDGTGATEGGLARMATLIRRIRAAHPSSLLANTGDTIQGSAEALYTRGQALVEVLDRFGIDVYAPGNWDYLYGKDRFRQLFGSGTGSVGGNRWGAIAANAYDADSSDLLLPPRLVATVAGLRVGVVGLTTERNLVALGPWATEGIRFTSDAGEIPAHVAALREEAVDLVVLVSEFGLAKNILIAERHPGIDVVLSSDMHEETREPVVTSTGTLVSEVGQDGTRLAQFDLTLGSGGGVHQWRYRLHTIDSTLPPDPEIERLVAQVRSPFVAGSTRRPHRNPINEAVLDRPIDDIVGQTKVGLHRSNFSHEPMPAVIGGTSSDFLSTAIRKVTGADVAQFRGFRYGTHVPPGPIRLEDLYHFMPVGAQVASAHVLGADLRQNIEASIEGTLNPDPFRWTGGWLHAYAGLRFALDLAQPAEQRLTDLQVQRAGRPGWEDLDDATQYRYAGYWFPAEPEQVGGIRARGPVSVLRHAHAGAQDVAEVVADHLARHDAEAEEPRVRLLRPLPAPIGPNPEIQPLLGASSTGFLTGRRSEAAANCANAVLVQSDGGLEREARERHDGPEQGAEQEGLGTGTSEPGQIGRQSDRREGDRDEEDGDRAQRGVGRRGDEADGVHGRYQDESDQEPRHEAEDVDARPRRRRRTVARLGIGDPVAVGAAGAPRREPDGDGDDHQGTDELHHDGEVGR